MSPDSGPAYVGNCQSCQPAARRTESWRDSSTTSAPGTVVMPAARTCAASASSECGPPAVSDGSPPAVATRLPSGADRTSVVKRASGPSTASTPIAVSSFWLDAGNSGVSGSWAPTSPSPSTQIERPKRLATTAGSVVKRCTARARSGGTGALGASSAGSVQGAVVVGGGAGAVVGTATPASGRARTGPCSSASLHAATATNNAIVSAAALLCLIPR